MESFAVENANKLLQQTLQHVDISKESSTGRFLTKNIAEGAEDNLIFAGKKTGTLHDWISYVNNKLNSSVTRLDGLVLLRSILSQCSVETFSECCLTWVRLLIAVFQPHQTLHIVEVTAGILIEILKDASKIPEISRQLATNHIPGLLGVLLDAEKAWSAPSLRLLAACMQRFPGQCGAISYKLEAYIISQLYAGTGEGEVQMLAQQCYPLLARLGGGGAGGVKYTDAFSHFQKRILITMHNDIQSLYADYQIEPASSVDEDVDPIPLPSPPAEEPSRTLHIASRIEVLSACLQNMLREEFPAKAEIDAKTILEFVSRTLEVTSKTQEEHVTAEISMVAFVIPKIHLIAMQIMSALVESCHVIHYNQQINQLYLKTLGWTQLNNASKAPVHHYRKLRLAAYESVVSWLMADGAATGLAAQGGDRLVEWCMKDASFPSDITKLASGVQTKKDKKGTKVKVKGQTVAETGSARVDMCIQQALCTAALEVLRQLLLTSGMKLKPNLYDEVCRFIIQLATRIQSIPPSDLLPPYNNSACRSQLYKVLLATLLVPHPLASSSPLNLAVKIFSQGKNEPNIEVSGVCAEAALICSAIIHPRRPPIPRPGSKTSQPISFSASSETTPTIRESELIGAEGLSSLELTSGVAGSPPTSLVAGEKPEELPVSGSSSLSSSLPLKPGVQAATGDIIGLLKEGDKDTPVTEPPLDISMEESQVGVVEAELGEEPAGEGEAGVEIARTDVEETSVTRQSEGTTTLEPRKRKRSVDESPEVKKPASEETVLMMESFVDAPPDSD